MYSQNEPDFNLAAGERNFALQPWVDHPHELISWFEMLEFSAQMFFWCGRALRHIRNDCYIASSFCPSCGEVSGFNLGQSVDDKARAKAIVNLKSVETQFRNVDMQITADTVKELIEALENPSRMQNFQWLVDRVATLEGLAEKELKGKAFFYVSAERAKFFPKTNAPFIFGEEVSTAFYSANFDIAESGVCLSLDRGTACVFHLMRVLEIGLTALGAKFGISLARTNWAPAIEQIESKIKDMHRDPIWKVLPDCKEQQEFYAQAASHFGILKDAWRNYTMHARGTYTEEQAEGLFQNVKGFMQKLSTRLHE